LRDPSGELTEAAGVLEPILSLVQQVSETGDKKKQEKLIASETPKFVDAAVKSSLPYISKSGPYYLRVLTKIVEKGPGYPKKEFERLSKLIEKTRKSDTEGDVSAFQAQLDDLIIRRNVLNSIVSSSSSRGHEEL
jgi:protein disulfide-isomerase A6